MTIGSSPRDLLAGVEAGPFCRLGNHFHGPPVLKLEPASAGGRVRRAYPTTLRAPTRKDRNWITKLGYTPFP
jgi:hypothetical protein